MCHWTSPALTESFSPLEIKEGFFPPLLMREFRPNYAFFLNYYSLLLSRAISLRLYFYIGLPTQGSSRLKHIHNNNNINNQVLLNH